MKHLFFFFFCYQSFHNFVVPKPGFPKLQTRFKALYYKGFQYEFEISVFLCYLQQDDFAVKFYFLSSIQGNILYLFRSEIVMALNRKISS